MDYIKLLFLFFITALDGGDSQPSFSRCPRLNITDLGSSDSVSSEGIISEAVGFPVQINRFNILCLSSADFMDRYQSTSVLVGYFCPECPGNGTMEEIVEQFTFDCNLPQSEDEETPAISSWSSRHLQRASPTNIVDFSTETETSCALCEHPSVLNSSVSLSDYNQNTHCIRK